MAQLPQKLMGINIELITHEAPLCPLMKATLKVQRIDELNYLSWSRKPRFMFNWNCLHPSYISLHAFMSLDLLRRRRKKSSLKTTLSIKKLAIG